MLFGKKLKQLRIANNMTQPELAAKVGVTLRTVQYYEACQRYPEAKTLVDIAAQFGVSTDFLLSEEDRYVIEAAEKGGSRSKRDVQTLITEVGALFAGGDISDEDKEKVMRTINDLYWKSKDYNKKYGKRRGTDGGDDA